LTTTSYAILGLLDLQDWTAYELTQQARRSLAFVWPVSESQLYLEPKRLAQEGLVTIRTRPAGQRRTRQSLSITAAGRRELRRWLATEPAAPRLQAEFLVRTLFATAGDKQNLLDSLAATKRTVQAAYDYGLSVVQAYQLGENPFPERLHVNVLWMVFVHDLLRLIMDWIEWAYMEITAWPDSRQGGDLARINRLLDAMLSEQPVISPPPRTKPAAEVSR
jgi:DNA-binding PadR family transcriptional regulator